MDGNNSDNGKTQKSHGKKILPKDFGLNRAAKSLVLNVPTSRILGRSKSRHDKSGRHLSKSPRRGFLHRKSNSTDKKGLDTNPKGDNKAEEEQIESNVDDEDGDDDKHDFGKLKMGKSVISLLTTTSMYSEFNNFSRKRPLGLKNSLLNLHDKKNDPTDSNQDYTDEEKVQEEGDEENEDNDEDEDDDEDGNEDEGDDEDGEEDEDDDEDEDQAYSSYQNGEQIQPYTLNNIPGENGESDKSTAEKERLQGPQIPNRFKESENNGPSKGLEGKLTPFEKSVVRSLESKRHFICGVESSRIISSNRNIQVRAIALCKKLKSTFQVDPDDELIDDYSCWLLRDVLLQGHLYITKNYLFFFAYLPSYRKNFKKKTRTEFEDKQIMASTLSMKKRSVTSKYQRYWCVLKGSNFSVYSNSTNLYFPLLSIDLRYVLKVEVAYGNTTASSQSTLSKLTNLAYHDGSFGSDRKVDDLDSHDLLDSTKHINSDLIVENLRNRSSSLSNKEIIKPHKIRILTESKTYLFYSDNLHSANTWVSNIKAQIFTLKNKNDKVTIKLPLANLVDLEVNPIFENAENIRLKVLENSESYALDDYFFLFFNSCSNAVKSINKAIEYNKIGSQKDQSQQTSKDLNDTTSLHPSIISDNYVPSGSIREVETEISTINEDGSEEMTEDLHSRTKEGLEKHIEHKSALAAPKLLNKTNALKALNPKHIVKHVFGQTIQNGFEMWSSNPAHYEEVNSLERGVEDQYFVESEESRKKAAKRFRDHFALPDTEQLIATYYAYLQRNIPLYGKIYLGSSKICFRSLLPAIHTKMILPFYDVENCYKEKNFSFGYSGLVMVINGHEELFFEFSANESRDDCEYLLLKQLDSLKGPGHRKQPGDSDEQLGDSIKLSSSVNNFSEAEDIRKNEDKISMETGSQVPIIIKDFTFAKPNFKPKQKFKITCLTIGSRGDVQPYLALCKQLNKEGHATRIATHGEFREVVEKHGIEFKEIAGSPTELMSFMGNHGTISVSFLKDAKAKFTGWIDKLLVTSWEACQGSEILIESPSAMAGIHIAEALNIPYFRAFTMPWTRTRAYPHAFIVPELKKGGSYNYFTHVLFENVFWKGISSQVNQWRVETLGLDKTDLYQLQQNKVPFLYNVSPTVFPPSVDFADWVRVTGYWFLEEKETYNPPQALVDFMDKAKKDSKKLVYIGFGSIVVSDPKEMTKAVVQAVQKAGVRCILNKGWSNRLEGDKELEIELPPEIYNVGSIPHDWLFSHIDAAVHHGGSGTTGASLRAGVPTIIKPFFGDQFFYAHRVEDMNVGVYLKKLNKDSLAKAIKNVTTNTRIIKKAKSIGAKIRSEHGVQNAIEAIYNQLDYAQNLISIKLQLKQNSIKENPEDMLHEKIGDIEDYLSPSSSTIEGKPKASGNNIQIISHSRQNSSLSVDNEELSEPRRKSNSSWLLL